MEPKIQIIREKKLIGISLTMSLVANRTGELWRSFMPRRKEIKNHLNSELISLQRYDHKHFQQFDPAREFTKWAAVEVSSLNDVPEGMHTLVVPAGEYAIFLHKGSSNDTTTYEYIFGEWLPGSKYQLDHRPHFEILGEKYKNMNPESEEHIYIPVRLK